MPVGKSKIRKKRGGSTKGRSNANVVTSGRGRSWAAAKASAKAKAPKRGLMATSRKLKKKK